MADRAPAVAGLFYPDDPRELDAAVDTLLGPSRGDEHARAIVVPHAGYVYSGAVAASVYRRVHVPDVVVVLCPNHTGEGARAAVVTHGRFLVPGHALPIEEHFAEELREHALLTEDDRAHRREHALEVHLPFLVARNPKVHIVPICLGPQSFEACTRIGTAIADVIRQHGGDVLVVASTDMSHYVPADVAKAQDEKALERIEAMDARGLYDVVEREDISMCGYVPTTVTLVAAAALGADHGELVQYGNSGATSGDFQRVVGYAGLVLE